jgi:hypothetical protein
MIVARALSAEEIRAHGPTRRTRSLLLSIAAEFRRAMAAARRYDELKHECTTSAVGDAPRRLFEEFYC